VDLKKDRDDYNENYKEKRLSKNNENNYEKQKQDAD